MRMLRPGGSCAGRLMDAPARGGCGVGSVRLEVQIATSNWRQSVMDIARINGFFAGDGRMRTGGRGGWLQCGTAIKEDGKPDRKGRGTAPMLMAHSPLRSRQSRNQTFPLLNQALSVKVKYSSLHASAPGLHNPRLSPPTAPDLSPRPAVPARLISAPPSSSCPSHSRPPTQNTQP